MYLYRFIYIYVVYVFEHPMNHLWSKKIWNHDEQFIYGARTTCQMENMESLLPAAPAEVANGPLRPLQTSRPAARRSSPPISILQSSALVLPGPMILMIPGVQTVPSFSTESTPDEKSVT